MSQCRPYTVLYARGCVHTLRFKQNLSCVAIFADDSDASTAAADDGGALEDTSYPLVVVVPNRWSCYHCHI